jgi:hypothetical protein
MMYPIMVKIDFREMLKAGKNVKPVGNTCGVEKVIIHNGAKILEVPVMLLLVKISLKTQQRIRFDCRIGRTVVSVVLSNITEGAVKQPSILHEPVESPNPYCNIFDHKRGIVRSLPEPPPRLIPYPLPQKI